MGEQFIEIREYAQPAKDGEEIIGPLRWYIEGWVPTFPITKNFGVTHTADAAVPFETRAWLYVAEGEKL